MRIIAFILTSFCAGIALADDTPIRLLVVTGSHPFDPRFYSLFEGQKGIEWDKKTQGAKPCQAFTPDFAKDYDVVLLYDFEMKISDDQKKAFEGAFGGGRGLIVLHHALCSHPGWPKYREIAGGQFLFEARDGMQKSEFTGGIAMTYEPADSTSPITKDVGQIKVTEEPYKHVFISKEVTPILVSNNSESDHTVAWTKNYEKSRVVGIVCGHGGDIFVEPNYRKFIGQAITWAAGRDAAPQK